MKHTVLLSLFARRYALVALCALFVITAGCSKDDDPGDNGTAPVASFTADKTSGNTPLTVNLASTSTNATSLEWSVAASSGGPAPSFSSTSSNASVTFNNAGTYVISLKAKNSSGENTSTKTITATDVSNPCVTNNTAEITFALTGSSNPYKVYIDGVYKGTMNGTGYKTYTVSVGNHDLKVEQESGFVFTPTIKQTSFNVAEACESYTWNVSL